MTQACSNGDQPSCSKWLLSTMTIAYDGGGCIYDTSVTKITKGGDS